MVVGSGWGKGAGGWSRKTTKLDKDHFDLDCNRPK